LFGVVTNKDFDVVFTIKKLNHFCKMSTGRKRSLSGPACSGLHPLNERNIYANIKKLGKIRVPTGVQGNEGDKLEFRV
jgi:hypothetical protein